MRIGIDFDNTIICYDGVFHEAALEKELIHEDFPRSKELIRNSLRERGLEDLWTELQGFVYGVRIDHAEPFDGVLEFLVFCRKSGVDTCIISHKTPHPYRGPRYDLHGAALDWMGARGFFESSATGLSPGDVYLEPTKEEKLERIGELRCTHFIDDLPEFLGEPAFPDFTEPILFDPHGKHEDTVTFRTASGWHDIERMLHDDLPDID